jgi:protein tyrosine phosphatase (PTP) superfamily phosphohydrolase (DUF442 family)
MLVPALLLQVPSAVIPDAVEVHSRIFVLRTAPTQATYNALNQAGITHVVNLRRDGEPGFDAAQESEALNAAGVTYVRLAIGKTPTRDDLDLFRMILGDLPRGAKVLVHCGNGNRAAGALCTWLVLDKGLKLDAALELSRQAGLANPDTEGAVRKYIESKLKS